jgi:galactose mutarotase-like enzyme
MQDAVTIERGRLKARIRAEGAELTSFTVDGRELIWQADPAYWGWHAPNLFPIVGALADDTLIHQGRSYPLPPHGFLRRTTCSLAETSTEACLWRLADSDATRAAYPFRFLLEIAYRLEPDALAVRMRLENPAGEPLVASIGIHPAFNWPLAPGLAREDHRLIFEKPEPAPIRRLAGRLIGLDARPTPIEGRVLHLHDGLFVEDAIIMDRPASRAVAFGAPGGPAVELASDDFSHLGIWTKPGAPYLCIEPWQGYASPADFTGEFAEKPGTVTLQPGEKRDWNYRIRPLDRMPPEDFPPR